MQFPPGTRLGPYEIVSLLGAGGMGEVYRARDARLSREVAIKVLPESVAQDADALARFEREARAVAALSHPNILGIFDIGKEGGAVFAVTELLEGRTLRDELGSALSVRKSTDYAIQIARGLAAAHEKGIVHRDLKPENVFVTRDGRVKILDFGLAKRLESVSGSDSKVQTMSHKTEPGTVMGTAGYMSPEQVRGISADHRTDIFSFGAVLYEMLAGKSAFRRETASDTMAAILKEEPPELSESGRAIPPSIDRIVRHCLEKDPERRFQSASDVAFDLESLSQVTATSGPRSVAKVRSRLRLQTAALAAAILLLPLAWWLGTKRAHGGINPEFHRLTFERGSVAGARYGPEGQTVLFAAGWNGEPVKIYSTRPQTVGSTPLAVPDAGLLAMSKNGEMAIAVRYRPVTTLYSAGTLARVPLSGGAPRELLDDVVSADWSPDGSGLAAAQIVGGKVRLEYPIGKVLYETGGWINHVRISPDGKTIAFLEHPGGNDGGSVSVIPAAGGSKRDVSKAWLSVEGLAWRPDGREIWFTGTRFGAATKIYASDLSGNERLILASPNELTLWDVAPDGRVLLTEDDWRAQMSALAPGAKTERDLSNLDYALVRSITPDGKRIAFDESGEGGGDTGAVYVRPTDGGPATRLGEGTGGSFSPDGNWVVTAAGDGSKIMVLPIGAGQPISIPLAPIVGLYPVFLPDGKRVAFWGAEPGKANRIWIMSATGGKPQPISGEGIPFAPLAPSPDGRVVMALDPAARPTLFPVDGGAPRPVPGTTVGDVGTQWMVGGAGVYVIRTEGPSVTVRTVNVATGESKLWRTIVPADPAGVHAVARVYPTPDGRGYAYSFVRILSTLLEVKGLR